MYSTAYVKKSFLSTEPDTKTLQSIYFAYKVGIISCYSNIIYLCTIMPIIYCNQTRFRAGHIENMLFRRSLYTCNAFSYNGLFANKILCLQIKWYVCK